MGAHLEPGFAGTDWEHGAAGAAKAMSSGQCWDVLGAWVRGSTPGASLGHRSRPGAGVGCAGVLVKWAPTSLSFPRGRVSIFELDCLAWGRVMGVI